MSSTIPTSFPTRELSYLSCIILLSRLDFQGETVRECGHVCYKVTSSGSTLTPTSPRLWLLGRAHCQSPRQHRYRCCCHLRYTTNCLLFREMPMDILSSRGRIPGKQGGMHVVRNWHPSMQIPCTRAAQEAASVCTTAGTELARPPRNTTDSKVTTVSNELLWLWGILPRQICFHFLFWTRSGIWQAEKLLLGKDVMSCSQKSSHCLQDFDSCDHLMLT